MADASNTLQIIIEAKDNASKVLKDVSQSAQSMGSQFQSLAKESRVALAGGFAVATGALVYMTASFAESEEVALQLNQALKMADQSLGNTADQINNLSSALQQQSIYNDEAITKAQILMVQYGNIGNKVMPQATQAVLDLASATGKDLTAASKLVGLALTEPELGFGRLKREGIFLNESQQKLIETFVASGEPLKAQQLIIDELAKTYGGQALAKASSFNGQIEIMKNLANDTAEILGGALLTAINNLGGDKGFSSATNGLIQFNEYLKAHNDVATAIVIGIGGMAVAFGVLLVAALAVTASTIGVIVAAIVGLGAVIGAMVYYVVQNWDLLLSNLEGLRLNFIFNINSILESIIQWGASVIASFTEIFLQIYNVVVAQIIATETYIMTTLLGWVAKIQNAIGNIPVVVGKIFTDAKTAVLTQMEAMFSGVNEWWNKIKGVLTSIADAANNAINAVQRGLEAGKSALGIQSRQFGGFVDSTGLTLLHQGEFVLSKDMQGGRSPVPSSIQNTYNQPITVNANMATEGNWDEMSYRLSWILRNSR